MFTLYGGNGRTWAEMTPQEQKISLIVMGIMSLGIIACGICYFFKNRKDKRGVKNQMKNQKGISLIKLILIIVVVVIAIFFIVLKINQRMEEVKKEEQEAQSEARYEASYNIGDTITTSSYEITVKNIEERTKVGIPKYYKTVDDYYYTLVCAKIEMKNITNEPKRIYDYRPDFSMYFKLEDDNKRTYYNDSEFTTYYQYEFDNFNYSQFTINPGETVTVTPVFKMDKSKYQNHTFYLNILGNTALVKIQ